MVRHELNTAGNINVTQSFVTDNFMQFKNNQIVLNLMPFSLCTCPII